MKSPITTCVIITVTRSRCITSNNNTTIMCSLTANTVMHNTPTTTLDSHS